MAPGPRSGQGRVSLRTGRLGRPHHRPAVKPGGGLWRKFQRPPMRRTRTDGLSGGRLDDVVAS